MGKTSIEWTGLSWNPIRARRRDTGAVGWHCQKVSPGCALCYAERLNNWVGTGLFYRPHGPNASVEIFLDERMLWLPLRWRGQQKVFVCSMTDLFGDFVPSEILDRVFSVMAMAPHTFQVLTKRPERMRAYLTAEGIKERIGAWAKINHSRNATDSGATITVWPLPNVWLGVSVEDQQRADERVPPLLQTPAEVRWISAEPLLGPVDLTGYYLTQRCGYATSVAPGGRYPFEREFPSAQHRTKNIDLIDWVVAGAESGPGARTMDETWVRSLRDQCAAAGTAFFYKQRADRGRKVPTPELDGRRWVDFPAGATT